MFDYTVWKSLHCAVELEYGSFYYEPALPVFLADNNGKIIENTGVECLDKGAILVIAAGVTLGNYRPTIRLISTIGLVGLSPIYREHYCYSKQ